MNNHLRLSILVVALTLLVVLPFCSAEQQTLGYFKQGSCVNLIQTCGSCTYNNISSVKAPNSTTLLVNTAMNQNGVEWTLEFCNTSSLGTYIVNGVGDLDSATTVWAYDFTITGNGNPSPSGGVIVAFGIVFVALFGYLIYMMVYMLAHVFIIDYDALDVGFTVGGYFMLLALFMLEGYYLGNPDVHSWLKLFIEVGIVTHVVLPMFAFVFSMIVGSYAKKRLHSQGMDRED